MRRDVWVRVMGDATRHYNDALRRSISDLDRQDEHWTREDMARMLARLESEAWLSWEAMPPRTAGAGGVERHT